MLNALTAAVSGLRAEQQALDVVGGNLANVNTAGYKANVIAFKETFNQVVQAGTGPSGNLGSVNPLQVGVGVGVGTLNSLYTQGSLNVTGKNTDMAITGNGFFGAVQSDGTRGYTRNGAFSLDRDGFLVNGDGFKVTAWGSLDENGVVDTVSDPGAVQIRLGQTYATVPTSQVAYGGNLDGSLVTPNTPSTKTTLTQGSTLDSTLANGTIVNMNAGSWVDCIGDKHAMNFKFTKTTAPSAVPGDLSATWTLDVVGIENSGGWKGTATPTQFTITFDTAGNLSTINNGTSNVYNRAANFSATNSLAVDVNIDSLSPFSAAPQNMKLVFGTDGAAGTSPTLLTADKFFLGANTTGLVGATSDGTSAQQVSSSVVYDSLGNSHSVDLTFTKSNTVANSTGTWTWRLRVDGEPVEVLNGSGQGTLVFDSQGMPDLTMSSPQPFSFRFTPPLTDKATGRAVLDPVTGNGKPSGAAEVSVTMDFGQITQLASKASNPVVARTQNGVPSGILQTFTVGVDGTLSGVFSNGLTRDLGRICIWQFPNTQGLMKGANGMLLESPASGQAIKTLPAATGAGGGGGTITGGALENSNVDISQEFTHMITAQRSFQANAKMVSTVDEVLNELANLKR